jgi:hypothetical protein
MVLRNLNSSWWLPITQVSAPVYKGTGKRWFVGRVVVCTVYMTGFLVHFVTQRDIRSYVNVSFKEEKVAGSPFSVISWTLWWKLLKYSKTHCIFSSKGVGHNKTDRGAHRPFDLVLSPQSTQYRSLWSPQKVTIPSPLCLHVHRTDHWSWRKKKWSLKSENRSSGKLFRITTQIFLLSPEARIA